MTVIQCCFSAIIFVSTVSPAIADLNDSKVACSEPKSATISTAFDTSNTEISMAIELLEAAASPTIDKYTRWLGAPSSDVVAGVIEMLQQARAYAGFQQSWCPNSSTSDLSWENGDLAGVHPSSVTDIFFVDDYFDISPTGIDSQSSTVIHEILHQVGANLQPEVYLTHELEALAANNPERARRNAQSLEYLVTDLLYGL
ncbi:M35 family metallo-endopeptidase [uncultured Pelagimonas sp.]|uniref:M35 family metallo-endopeptidase n=1 Tax=uncultured Pelagimonas sp. TaxID=1618102 RepID=UPI002627B108|nr:M35 family metallo-endopeptidase [uncultured Pelagimonas sp.]